jgi:putative phage-type endonuclease
MIGGSDAHHLLNIEPYGCARQLWYDKSGIKADEEFDVTGAIRRGNRLEDVAVDYYCEQTGRQVLRMEAQRHPQHPFIGVHVDREIVAWPEDPGPGVLEVKTVGEQMYWHVRKEGLPERYILQLQWAMLVRGYQWGEFVVYWPDQDELLHFPAKRNRKLIDALFAAGVEFWPRIAKKDPPERLRDDSEQCGNCRWAERCQGAHMRELLERWQGQTASRKPELAGMGEDYFQAQAASKDVEALVDEVKDRIKQAMGEDLEAMYPPINGEPGLKVLYKPDLTWDEERLAAERPDIYAKFTTPALNGTALSKSHPELESTYKTKPKTRRTLRVYLKEDQQR